MILICGGAGYIGSHMVRYLNEMGEAVLVVDNLSTGHRGSLPQDVSLCVGDIRDRDFLSDVFKTYPIDTVFHFCASSLVEESMKDPLSYYDNNVGGTIVLLEMMRDFNVSYIVFSSSAAVYGNPYILPITEEEPLEPNNTYGETKVTMEKLLKWTEKAYGVKWAALRYFNVGGAWENGLIGEDHNPETHLIPLLLQVALGKRDKAYIFGQDYETLDGTCIRDYIHVMDVVEGHLQALAYLRRGGSSDAFNLGSGRGYSVKEVIDQVKMITEVDFEVEIKERRLGDPKELVADSGKAKEVLEWSTRNSQLEHIIESAWKFMKKHPGGYNG